MLCGFFTESENEEPSEEDHEPMDEGAGDGFDAQAGPADAAAANTPPAPGPGGDAPVFGRVNVDTTGFTPLQFFELYVDDDLLHCLVVETNRKAHQHLGKENIPPHARCRAWYDVTPQEMKQFLGLLFLTGIISKPALSMYWSQDPLYATPIFGKLMSRDRFLSIYQFLHFNDNTTYIPHGEPGHDNLFKVRPLIDHLFEKFQEVYTPECALSIDESLVKFKGRLRFRVYIPCKKGKYGMKVEMTCEASTGYCYRFHMYSGEEDPAFGIADILSRVLQGRVDGMGKTEKLVIYMLLPLLGTGHRVFMDNWFNTVRLSEFLKSEATDLLGTMRANRVPTELRGKQVTRGQVQSLVKNDIQYLKFQDKKMVYLVSTTQDASVQEVTERGGRKVTKPSQVLAYNANMGGVDLVDRVRI